MILFCLKLTEALFDNTVYLLGPLICFNIILNYILLGNCQGSKPVFMSFSDTQCLFLDIALLLEILIEVFFFT